MEGSVSCRWHDQLHIDRLPLPFLYARLFSTPGCAATRNRFYDTAGRGGGSQPGIVGVRGCE